HATPADRTNQLEISQRLRFGKFALERLIVWLGGKITRELPRSHIEKRESLQARREFVGDIPMSREQVAPSDPTALLQRAHIFLNRRQQARIVGFVFGTVGDPGRIQSRLIVTRIAHERLPRLLRRLASARTQSFCTLSSLRAICFATSAKLRCSRCRR